MEEHSAQQSVWKDGWKQQNCNQVVMWSMQNIKFYNSGFLKDYICPEDISNTTITVEHGDYLTYNTNPGGAAE